MYRTIVVGCDGTAGQADAIALALRLRDPDGGRLLLVHAYSRLRALTTPGIAPGYFDWLDDRARGVVAKARAAIADPAVPVSEHIAGAPSVAAGVNELAEREAADLIVLGPSTHGIVADVTGQKTIQKLLHGAPCAVAVAVAGQQERFGAAARICVAFDGSPEARAALAAAYGLAARTGARVSILQALEHVVLAAGYVGVLDDGSIEAALRADLADAAAGAPAGVPVDADLLRGEPPYGVLLDAAAGADLIVAGSRGFGPLRRVLAGSTSLGLLKEARCAVLVTPRATVDG